VDLDNGHSTCVLYHFLKVVDHLILFLLHKPSPLTELRHRHMNQPLLINLLFQSVDMKSSVPIMHNLLGYSLPNGCPRRGEDALPSMQQTEVIPDIKINWLEIPL